MHDTASEIEVRNVLTGGGVEDWVKDWDAAAKLWEYSITSRLTGPRRSAIRSGAERGDDDDVEMADNAEELDDEDDEGERNPFAAHPLLMSEPGKSSTKTREKIIEIAMENWEVPAFYLAKTGVLASFSQGRPTALVVDVGASMISITPVVDGMVLKKGIRTSPLGGNFITQQTRLFFEQSTPPIPLVPHYMISSKIAVEAGQPSAATYKKFEKPPTDSFRAWHEDRAIHDFKESVVELWPGPGRLSDNAAAINENQPLKSYEMPDGWNNLFNIQDRRKIAEGLFAEKAAYTVSHEIVELNH
jgi:actin-related protein 4